MPLRPTRLRNSPKKAARHNRICQHSTLASQVATQQCARFITSELAPTVSIRNSDCAAVCIGVQGHDNIALRFTSSRDGAVEGARFFWVREGNSGKFGIRLCLLCHQFNLTKTNRFQGLERQVSADTVHWCKCNAQLPWPVSHTLLDTREILLARINLFYHPSTVGGITGHLICSWGGRNRSSNLCIERRDNLHTLSIPLHNAAAEVHFVPIVLRRVVRRGHHYARVGA